MSSERICWITRFCSFFIRLGIMDTTDRRGPMSISWFSPSVHLVERSRILIDPFPILSPLVTSFAFRERQLCRNFVISLCFPSLLLGWQFSFLAHIFKLFFWNFNDFRILLDPWRERKRERECDSHVRLFRNRREKETDRVSGFYSPSKADISSSLTVFSSSSSSSLLFTGKDNTFLFFFYFPLSWSPSIRGLILIPPTGMNTYDEEESRRTRSKNPFCFESIRVQIQEALYIALSRELVRAWRRAFHTYHFPPFIHFFFQLFLSC